MDKGLLPGIRVLELTQFVAAPLAGRILGSVGAEVIHIDSSVHPDAMVYLPAAAPGSARAFYNSCKRLATLNMSHPEGKRILTELIKKSDVFLTNWTADAQSRAGISIDALREANPGLIVIWLTGFGAEGPYARYRSLGGQLQFFSGLAEASGFPDGTPMWASTAMYDFHAAHYLVLYIIGALDRRRRTGRGTCIELPLAEIACCDMSSTLDYVVNGRNPQRNGNRHPWASPHGAYPCKGEDRWCVIAVFTDQQWKAFCQVLEHPAWTEDPRFSTLLGRIRQASEVDERVAEWTQSREAEEVMNIMQKAGVPAGYVMKGQDLVENPHLEERQFYQRQEYYEPPCGKDAPVLGTSLTMKIPIRFSETPCRTGGAGRFGQDNDYVYGSILGMSSQEIKRLVDEGALI